MIRLGPLQLHDRLGAGAMGVVWRARHRLRDLDVAVKVLRPTKDPKRQSHAFRAEIRAMARLDHPSIAYVHDAGFAPNRSADRTGGIVADGAPYLVMQLLEGPSLQRFRGRLPWPQLRAVLLGLLDALGHAHARGVLHLDLKPANIIADPVRWTVHLTDFGLARLRDDDGDDERLTGTPAFMAPEQVQGRGRTMGPWTDLYAVGCLAWCLACGRSPFARKSVHETLMAQLGDDPPPLEANHPLPDGFEAWIKRLLRKSHRARYRHTADAAWALSRLDTPVEPPGPLSLPPITLSGDSGIGGASPAESTLVEPVVAGHIDAIPEVLDHAERAPLPPAPPGNRLQRTRLGVGLFDLRPLPLVGRRTERAELWSALSACHTEHRSRVVVLGGRHGAGKSHLVDWLGVTAAEVGGAITLRAMHSDEPGTGLGLGPMFGRALRCEGLATESIPMHLLSYLGADAAGDAMDWRMWSDLISGLPMPRGARHSAALNLMRAITRERPAILWIDDAQWAPDSLAFAESLIDGPGADLPVLVVCAVCDDEVGRHPEATQRLASLRLAGQSIDLEPLPREDVIALIRAMADLDDHTVMQIADRTAGHPQFAVQLMRHWVSEGLLVPTSQGVQLGEGVVIEVPHDLQMVWRERLDRLLARRTPAEALALELAATLGLEVDDAEWEAVSEVADADPSADLLSALLDARLARREDGADRWSFATAPFRETIMMQARQAGRLEAHHRRCGSHLDLLSGQAARAARHWMEADEPARAIRGFQLAFDQSADAGDLVQASWLLEAQDEALNAAGCTDDDPQRAIYLLNRSRLLRSSGSAAEAELDARSALELSRSNTWADLRLDALEQLGTAQCEAGELQAGVLTLEQALRSPEPTPDPRRRMRLGLAFARACLQVGDLSRARSAARGTWRLADKLGSDAYAAQALLQLAQLVTDADRRDKALTEAETRFARSNHRTGLAEVLLMRGDLAREAGDYGLAETHYRQAADLFGRMGSARVTEPRLAIGLSMLDQGLLPEAERALDEAQHSIQEFDTRKLAGPVSLLFAAVAAEQGDWSACELRLEEARRHLLRSELISADIARWAERLAQRALTDVRMTIAARAFDIAMIQHRGAGDTQGLHRLIGVTRELSRGPAGIAPPEDD